MEYHETKPQLQLKNDPTQHFSKDGVFGDRVLLYDIEARTVHVKQVKDGQINGDDVNGMPRCYIEPSCHEIALFADADTQTRVSKDPNEAGLSHVFLTKIYMDRLGVAHRLARKCGGGLRYVYVKGAS